jgi:hypothetical protein
MPIDWARDTVLRWAGPTPFPEALQTQGGIDAVVADAPAGSRNQGLWPGVRNPANRGRTPDDVASASAEPWVDANGWRIAYEQAVRPGQTPVLAYPANLGDRMVPFDTLALALIEARAAGGNYLLEIEPRFQRALLGGDRKAAAAWERLGHTAHWLRANQRLLGRPALPLITTLADSSSAEIVNLLFRRGASPAVSAASALPAPSASIKVLVAANLREPSPEVSARIAAHARRGGIVVGDGPWLRFSEAKPQKAERDRDFLSLGGGQVVVYHKRVTDPSEFALDVIDLIGHRQRAVRIWNASSTIATAGTDTVYLVNYGSPVNSDVQVRLQGKYTRAKLHRPDAAPAELKVAPRGSTSEVFVPELVQLGIIEFS